jgi:hypothetical protein
MMGIHRDYVYSVGKNIQQNIKENEDYKELKQSMDIYSYVYKNLIRQRIKIFENIKQVKRNV